MRGRSIRLTILILAIFVISIASLAFSEINIDIPGFPEVQRGGTGPLGLKLGLDLRGGAHLVYQADVGTRIRATFPEAADIAAVEEMLDEAGVVGYETRLLTPETIEIEAPLLDQPTRAAVESGLLDELGVVEAPKFTETLPPDADDMEGVISIISRRVNLFGTEEPIVQQFGEDRIIVQLPGASGSVTDVEFVETADLEDISGLLRRMEFVDYTISAEGDRGYRIRMPVSLPRSRQDELENAFRDQIGAVDSFRVTGGIEAAKSLIGETALLEFRRRICNDLNTDPECRFDVTDSDLGLTGDDLVDAYASTDPQTGEWAVNIQFNDRGADIFGELTRSIVGDPTQRIAVFIDDQLVIAPVARAWIRDGRSQITGNFNREEARTLSIQLESGRLPVPLELIQESEVDALLGSESLEKSLLAGIIGLGLVIVFMLVYYRVAGVVAALALIFYSIVVLAVFKMIPVTLTLPHIGGFILSIGLAVDANILIFERMKEEIRVGRTLASSMEVGFNRAWPAIRDGNVSTIITCGVLLWFGSRLGGGLINGFALSLLIGVIVSMFTAVVLSRNVLQLLAWAGLSRRINLFSPEKVERQPSAAGRPQAARGGR